MDEAAERGAEEPGREASPISPDGAAAAAPSWDGDEALRRLHQEGFVKHSSGVR